MVRGKSSSLDPAIGLELTIDVLVLTRVFLLPLVEETTAMLIAFPAFAWPALVQHCLVDEDMVSGLHRWCNPLLNLLDDRKLIIFGIAAVQALLPRVDVLCFEVRQDLLRLDLWLLAVIVLGTRGRHLILF